VATSAGVSDTKSVKESLGWVGRNNGGDELVVVDRIRSIFLTKIRPSSSAPTELLARLPRPSWRSTTDYFLRGLVAAIITHFLIIRKLSLIFFLN
jgi:hypothetical protein